MLWPKPVHMAIWMTNLLDVNKLGQGKPDKVMAECHSVSSRKKKKKKKITYIYIPVVTHMEVCPAPTFQLTGLRWTPVLHSIVTSNHRDLSPSGYHPSKANLKPTGISYYGKKTRLDEP